MSENRGIFTSPAVQFIGTVFSRNAGYVRISVAIEDLDSGLYWDGDYHRWGSAGRGGEANCPDNDHWLASWVYEFPASIRLTSGEYELNLERD